VPFPHIPRPLRSLRHLLVAALAAALVLLPLSAAAPAPAPAPARAAVPAACASDGAYVWANLATCGWPSRTTTGPKKARCGRVLPVLGNGPTDVIRLSTPGQQIRCRTISGCVDITAPGVVLRDVTVRCTSGRTGEDANGTGVVVVEEGASATLRRVVLRGMDGNHSCVWHMGTSVKVTKVDCAGVNDAVFSWAAGPGAGDGVRIRDSYFHDFTTKTANGHVDGYQTEGASHGRIVHNTWLMTSDSANEANSAIAIWDSLDDSDDFLVARNLIAGGGFAVYAEDYSPSESSPTGGFTVTDVRFEDNVFSTRLFPCVGDYGVWFSRGAPSDGWHRSGNRVLETGQSIDQGNPTAGGRSCT
jgi:hypothetical protein